MQRSHHRQSGLGLVEIMIALVVGLILIGGLLQLFISSRQTFAVQEGMARLQENGRFALALLADDLRETGYRGCTSIGPLTNTLNQSASAAYDFAAGVQGFDNIGDSPPTGLGIAAAVPGSDILVIKRMDGEPVRIVKNNNGAQLFAEVTGVQSGACADDSDRISGFCRGDILLVSDCVKSRVFQATGLTVTGSGAAQTVNVEHAASGTPGNASDSASWGGQSGTAAERFGEGAELARVASYVFYIAPGAGADAPPALFRQSGGVAEELIDNVEDMQILYGINTDDDAGRAVDDYVTAAGVSDWAQVVSIRLALLLRSPEDNLARQPQVYRFDGAEQTATDKRLRQEFETTITLRNRAK